MRKLVLIDGNAILYRAYHAMPGFTTKKGEPVGAMYGFVSMLLRIIQDLKPTHLIVAFDREAPTFRQTMYADYHTNRAEMPDDLKQQTKGVSTIIEAFDIPIFGVDGYEADDVIGTLAKQAIGLPTTDYSKKKAVDGRQSTVDNESEVIIVTGDRDLLQLVNEHVSVYMPIKGMSETKMYRIEDVKEKYGILPHQVVDLKALMGDASDNYPGVRGIGPKTASVLIHKYETLENLYQHLGELPQRQMKALADGIEDAGMAKKLATIACDVPIKIDWKACVFEIKDVQTVVKALRAHQFKTLTNRFLVLMGKEPIDFKKEADENQLKLV